MSGRTLARTVVGRPGRGAWPVVLAMGLAAVVAWYPFASAITLGAAALAAIVGAIAGTALALGRLRTSVVAVAVPAATALLAGGIRLAGRIDPGPLRPETVAALLDAVLVGTLSAGGALLALFLAERLRGVRPLAVSLVVLGASLLLAAHRGGAIHRPLALSDRAFLHGFHPAIVLAAAGAIAGAVAVLALVRWRSTRNRPAQALALVAAAAAVLALAPGVGLLTFPTVDPLGLSKDPMTDRPRPSAGDESGDDATGEGEEGDALGLSGEGAGDETIAPFRDEYTQQGAQAPVAVVTLHDDVDPLGGVFYFRQVAFSRFNGRRLVRALDARADGDLFHRFPTTGPLERDTPDSGEMRHPVPTTVSLMRDHAQPPVLTAGARIEPRAVADKTLFRRAYAARSDVLYGDASRLLGRSVAMDHLPAGVRDDYLELPDDPRYEALAREALAQIGDPWRDDPWARTVAVALWLERNTSYSLRSRHASSPDPTASFLFGDRVGYCVHLAHAAAYLARALGVPSRVAAGYAYRATDRAGGSALLLRAGDAHAWAEVWLDGVGWIPVDPSPPTLDPPILAPDVDLQRLLGELARPEEERLVASHPGSHRRTDWRRAALATALALLAAWALAGHAAKAWRRVVPRLAGDRRARLAYRAGLDRLAEAGLSRRPGESREAFAGRASALSPSFARLTEAHLAASFGRRPADASRSRRLLGASAREIAATGGARRLLGLLSPWRWTRSR